MAIGRSMPPREDNEVTTGTGLVAVQPAENCPGGNELDLIVRPFGSQCIHCEGVCSLIVLTAKEGRDSVDPRNLVDLESEIKRHLRKGDCRRIGICCVETLLLWNDLQEVVEFLMRVDQNLKNFGARGHIVLREELVSIEEFAAIRDIVDS